LFLHENSFLKTHIALLSKILLRLMFFVVFGIKSKRWMLALF